MTDAPTPPPIDAERIERTLRRLNYCRGAFPGAAVEEVLAHPEAYVPRLLSVLRSVADDPDACLDDEDGILYVFALYILCYLEETRALPLLMRLLTLPGELPLELLDDLLTEDVDKMFISLGVRSIGPLRPLIESPEVNEYVRAGALSTLKGLLVEGFIERGEVLDYFRGLLHSLPREGEALIWAELACLSMDLCLIEVRDEIGQLFEEGLVDTTVITREQIEEFRPPTPEAALELARLARTRIGHPQQSLGCYAWFRPETAPASGSDPDADRSDLDPDAPWFPADPPRGLPWDDSERPGTLFRTTPKVGRNAPCPCGSGKKYKKCCGG